MTTVARRGAGDKQPARESGPFAEMFEWLEANSPFSLRGVGLGSSVRVEDFTDEDAYVLRAEIPGIDPAKDVEVTIDGDLLTISGERREEVRDKVHRELHYGSFRRTVTLPRGTDPDRVSASYKDGLLEVRVPMQAHETPSVKVPVQRAE